MYLGIGSPGDHLRESEKEPNGIEDQFTFALFAPEQLGGGYDASETTDGLVRR